MKGEVVWALAAAHLVSQQSPSKEATVCGGLVVHHPEGTSVDAQIYCCIAVLAQLPLGKAPPLLSITCTNWAEISENGSQWSEDTLHQVWSPGVVLQGSCRGAARRVLHGGCVRISALVLCTITCLTASNNSK